MMRMFGSRLASIVALIAIELASSVSVNLRGIGPAPGPAPATIVDDRGERGHFYYADECEDCYYKFSQCGCKPSMEYFACLAKHCYSSNRTRFADKCAKHGNDCFDELDIDCRGPDTVCEGKFHQLPMGGLGLSLDLNDATKDAFCGPFGKCIGEIHMKASIHNARKLLGAVAIVGAPSPSVFSPAPGPAASAPALAVKPVWLECGLPKVSKASVDKKEDWVICQAEAQGDTAACDIPMFPKLKASREKRAYCVLTDGPNGERLTQPAFQDISNIHDKIKKQKKREFAPTMEMPTLPYLGDESTKLPWMEDKEARQAKRAKQASKEAKENKKAAAGSTQENEKAAAKNEQVESDSRDTGDDFGKPPWMQGKL